MKKSGKLARHVVNSNIATGSLPTLQISVGIVALFEKIYFEVPHCLKNFESKNMLEEPMM
jgi:hypothetical protein